jgi:ketosteroid isomerase-like protein
MLRGMSNALSLLARLLFGTAMCLAAARVLAAEPVHPALAEWAQAWAQPEAAPVLRLYRADAHLWAAHTDLPAHGAEAVAATLAEARRGRVTFRAHSWRELRGVAVASGILELTFVEPDGDELRLPLRFTIVWVAEAEAWRILDQHLSMVPAEE